MTNFSVVFGFLFLCVYMGIYCIFFIFGYHEVLIQQSVCKQDCLELLFFSFQIHLQYPALYSPLLMIADFIFV